LPFTPRAKLPERPQALNSASVVNPE